MTEERYEIIKLLGKGRTGGVYEAEDSNLGRKVALRRFFAQGDDIEVDVYKEDFEKVAQSLSVLQHPNLLRVYDAGVDGDGAYIISQLLKGETLHDKITNEGAMPAWEVCDMAQQMLDALSTAHQEGYVHGAITPGSILLSPRARGGFLYVILDMGLSRLAPLIQGKDSILAIMADPAILAPELFDGGLASERGDLYMLGQILYMSLAGGHPFGGVSAKVAQSMHQAGLPPLQQFVEDVPEDFRLWIEKLVQFNPDNRPESAVEALNSIPKVPRPARNPATAVHSTTAQLKTGTAPQAQSPADSVSSDPVTSTVASLPVAQHSSKKGLFIGLGAFTAVAGVIAAAMIFGGKTNNKGSIVQNTEEPTSRAVSTTSGSGTSYAERHAVEEEKRIIASFDGTNSENAKGWNTVFKQVQSATQANDGWSINSVNFNKAPGIRFPLKTNENDMFDFGWKLTYVVRPIKGKHRIGFSFDQKLNPGWSGDVVSLYLSVEHTASGEVRIAAQNSDNQPKSGKSVTLPDKGVAGWYTIVITQKPESESGAYTLTIDGKLGFSDTFTKEKKFGSWDNHLFSSSFFESSDAHWVIKELKLETQ